MVYNRVSMNVPILMYHKIQLDPASSDLAVSPDAFRAQVACLKAEGYHTVSLRLLSDAVLHSRPLPKRPVVITFDDAYQDVYTIARPVLAAAGYTATVFVVSSALGRHNFWDDDKGLPRETCLGRREVKALAEQGWEIGSHSATHACLPKAEDRQLQAEVAGSRRALQEALALEIPCFAYPYGAWDERSKAAAQAAGYYAACAIAPGTASVTADLFALRRVYVKPGDSLADFKRKKSFWYLRYRAWRKR
ncbi:polysaccharide deacetylase family protein [candidate division FCPU426 bacterium]|nr:polysaccharide deacetylase family protein [candidate division FCPU426 bacterium]